MIEEKGAGQGRGKDIKQDTGQDIGQDSGQEKDYEQPKPFLTFFPRLRRQLRTASLQLENGLGQEDITINKEVEEWLNK